MKSKRTTGTYTVMFILTCMCLTMLLGSTMRAASLLPWERQDSVSAALALQEDGRSVSCEGVIVCRIAARNNPSYFVITDQYSANTDNKIVVLCRVPSVLKRGTQISVEGKLGTMPFTGERCIYDPTVYGFFNAEGKMVSWVNFPFGDFPTWLTKEALELPTSPIPQSDPSLPDDGMGIWGPVTADTTDGVLGFETVASLLATAPPVLSPIKLACKPVVEVGNGFIIVGDDNSNAAVKVYTNATIKPTDRVIKLTGTAHSENGKLVVYGGDGPPPFFDPQGFLGGIFVARIGTIAYSATLTDPARQGTYGAARAYGVPSDSEDGSWIYLPGQVVTYTGSYYSYNLDQLISVYYIQGLDGTSGIRVLQPVGWPPYDPSYTGSVVDIMAKVNTNDGQRQLGFWNSSPWYMLDQNSVTHSLEVNVLATRGSEDPELPMIAPVGMNHRALCGDSLGSNPGVTDGVGLYNIGSYVTVWGKVLEAGYYYFDQYINMSYIRIDDGSYVLSGNSTPSYGGPYGDRGVTVFGYNANLYDPYTSVEVNDYVSITGISSVWKPDGSTDKYRSIWTSGYALDRINPPETQTTSEVVAYGTVSGTVKLYDMPTSEATVWVRSTCGGLGGSALTITRNETTHAGSAQFSWNNVPKEVEVTEEIPWPPFTQTHTVYPEYIVSAQCDDYKTRTYTRVTPDVTRNVYMTPLRKIYVTANTASIGGCSGTATITATVRDADRNLVTDNLTIRFRTNKGSFVSGGSIEHEASRTTSTGAATATLYGVPSEWGNAIVEATDDSAPLTGDNPTDDPYKYDWQQLHDQWGQPILINISQPTISLQLQPDPIVGTVCENQKALTATLTVCGTAKSGETVTFYTSNGTFLESGTSTRQTTTDTSGAAIATLVRPEACTSGEANVYAASSPYAVPTYSNTIHATWQSWKLKVTVSPFWTVTGSAPPTVKATLTLDDGTTVVTGQSVTLTTNQGHFANNQTSYTANTNSSGEISTTLTVTNCPVTATVTGTTIALPCNCTFTDSGTLRVVCQQPTTPVEIFFCLDSTGSMQGTGGDHRAIESVQKFLDDLYANNVILKLGGVKFNDPYSGAGTDNIDMAQFTSLNSFSSVTGFISSWLNNGYSPDGYDAAELQLDALHLAAQDVNAYSTAGNPNRYIVLITDNVFHENEGGSSVTKSQVTTELTNSGARVYISLWEQTAESTYLQDQVYNGLAVNAGEFDQANRVPSAAIEDKYPLARLRARVMTDWP